MLGKKYDKNKRNSVRHFQNSYKLPKLPFLYTPLYVEFKNNSSASKNSGFIDESIENMLRVGTTKESSTKSSVIIHFQFQQKGKNHLILDRP